MNITFDNVSFKYIEKKILDNVSFSIDINNKIGVVGLNGCGKSTMLKLILGIEKPISGNIVISGGTRINYLEQDPKFDNTYICPSKHNKVIVALSNRDKA